MIDENFPNLGKKSESCSVVSDSLQHHELYSKSMEFSRPE